MYKLFNTTYNCSVTLGYWFCQQCYYSKRQKNRPTATDGQTVRQTNTETDRQTKAYIGDTLVIVRLLTVTLSKFSVEHVMKSVNVSNSFFYDHQLSIVHTPITNQLNIITIPRC